MMRKKSRNSLVRTICIMLLTLLLSGQAAAADMLVVTEYRITSSYLDESQPSLGANLSTELVVYTQIQTNGFGDIVYQPLLNGAPNGASILVAYSPGVDEKLNDMNGDYIVYTSMVEGIVIYRISDTATWSFGDPLLINEPHIHGDWVVWLDTGQVMLYNLNNLGTAVEAQPISGIHASNLEIGDQFVVWVEGGDIFVWDLDTMSSTVIGTVDWDRTPSTSGNWVVWCAGPGPTRIEALNMDTNEHRTVVDDGSLNLRPSIDGDLIAWESNAAGNFDIWVYRISTGETFQVISESHDQQLANVYGNLVAYVDSRAYNKDVWVSRLEFNPQPIANAGLDQVVHAGTVVTLDGSASSDPEGETITYSWQITSAPPGSTALLSDSTMMNPSFTADLPGDYIVELIVTDIHDIESTPDTVDINASNTGPIADAGSDQLVTVLGTTVQLDGTQSWDPEGDMITYSWNFLQIPAGSAANLSNPTSALPTFVFDAQGDYIVELMVSDPWTSIMTDTVTISSLNIQPIADPGGNQSVHVGDSVLLDGSGSYDANGDPLAYSWSFVYIPTGSSATLTGETTSMASFVADVGGSYMVSLVVNDGIMDSGTNVVTIFATITQDEVTDKLDQSIDTINLLDPSLFKNRNQVNALTNKITAVLEMINQGLYQQAMDKLQNDLLQKTDGCAVTGSPDSNDWIEDCETQGEVYPLIIDTIALLQELINGG